MPTAQAESFVIIANKNIMPHEPLKPNDRLQDRYVITRVHHLSGLGALYEARDSRRSENTPPCAIKEDIIQDSYPLAKTVANFTHKAKLLLTLDHPTIPTTSDHFIVGDRTYLVMEFVGGENLESVLFDVKNPLPVEEVLRWAIQLCEVLNYLHTFEPEPIIFRDLKPANIIITPQREVRLVDFGIAVAVSDMQKIHEPLGTDGYAAPEQYNGEVSPAIDIYALGATLHHMLTGRDPRLEPPFSFDRWPIRQINPAVPEALEKVVMRALAHRPPDRFPSAADMLLALKEVGEPG